MSDVRDLNFEAVDEILECMQPKEVIDAIIKASDAYKMNDILEYIVRCYELKIDPSVEKQLAAYKGDDGN